MLMSSQCDDEFGAAFPASRPFVAATFTSVFAPARQQGCDCSAWIRGANTRAPRRSEKPPDENARHAPVLHKGFSKRQDPRITRQRPHLRDVFLVFEAE